MLVAKDLCVQMKKISTSLLKVGASDLQVDCMIVNI